MTHPPKVSICIPTYNGARYIREAVVSALQQEYPSFEIVIVDNCSTDGTEVLLSELLLQSDKIHFFKNETNIGLAGNFNKCLEHAQGEYIKYLCADDFLLPGCLEQMAAVLESHPTVSLVCSGRTNINESRPLGLRRYSSRTAVVSGYEAINRCLFGGNFIGEPTATMFRKSDARSEFRNDLPQLLDMDMWFRLLERGDLYSIASPLCAIRCHSAQITQENIKSGKIIDDNILIFDEFSKKAYLRVSFWPIIRHKWMMAYRVWVSRQYISKKKRWISLNDMGLEIFI
ncbi:glycosyltransferase family 2 protein [Phyllobacterium leguminum]|uniref:Glycosyltransferase involved in cell wall biosynthesis n=1 Tax=Phyllobacterium leguminum TaxID=314237 RepID=A0A318TAA4_9HYPH|nr:glycosyltransferase family 2 protein [Phyllobacterium leguminum]PYE85248.1 glycosyltransferase involved in cell wall biosynthesis [Phyllobacterium leguminum]